MLKQLYIKGDKLIPTVFFDKNDGKFYISGVSFTNNAYDFYLPVASWLKEYFKKPNKKTKLFIHLEYLNSASLLQIKNIIDIFDENQTNSNIKIIWLFEDDDDTLKETGEELKQVTTLDIELKSIGNNFNILEFINNYE